MSPSDLLVSPSDLLVSPSLNKPEGGRTSGFLSSFPKPVESISRDGAMPSHSILPATCEITHAHPTPRRRIINRIPAEQIANCMA